MLSIMLPDLQWYEKDGFWRWILRAPWADDWPWQCPAQWPPHKCSCHHCWGQCCGPPGSCWVPNQNCSQKFHYNNNNQESLDSFLVYFIYLKSISTLFLDHFTEDVVSSLSSSFTWQSSITLDPVTISGLVEAVNIWEEFLTSMVKSLILEVSLFVTASQVYTPSSSCWILSNVTLLVRRSSDIFHEKIKCQ